MEEVRSLRALVAENRSWPEIARALNRSCAAVQQRAREHGLTKLRSG